MRRPFAIAAVTATVGLTGLIVAGVSRGPATAGDPAGAVVPARADAEPERLIDAARLTRGLEQMPKAVPSRRDPFRFGTGGRDASEVRRTEPPSSLAVEWGEPQAAARPPLQLLGIAEDAQADGAAVRTAILSGMNQVFLVKAGEQVAFRFLVRHVDHDAVEIEDLTDEAILRLTLR